MPKGIYKHKEHLSDEHKNKISIKNRGRTKTPEEIEKLRSSHLGKKLSEETKKRIGVSSRGRIPWNKTNSYIQCIFCKKVIHRSPSNIKKGKNYCGKSCLAKNTKNGRLNKGKVHSKEWIKKQSISNIGKHSAPKSKETKEKMHLAAQKKNELGINCGSSHYKWIKDRTKVIGRNSRKLHDPEYKQWRKKICNRDNWKCKIDNNECRGRLEVHHILGFKEYPELRYDINNGICLCHAHHPKSRAEEKRLVSDFQKLVPVSK